MVASPGMPDGPVLCQPPPLPDRSSTVDGGATDMADYWDEFQPVKVRFAKNLSEGLHIRLDPETMNQLRSEAAHKGIGPTTLARMWIKERLQGKKADSAEVR